MNKLTLNAEKREVFGRKVKRLRKDGVLPANIFGKKIKSTAVQLNTKDFEKVYKEAGETGLIELIVNGDKKPVLVHNVQLDPVSASPLHADFLQVDLKEKVTAQVPVELIGESPAEKQGLGTVVQYIDEIEVEALPSDLPDKFEIDASKLTEVDQVVLIKNLPIEKGKVELKVDLEQILVKVEPPRKEEVEAPTVEIAEGAIEEEAVPGEEGKEKETGSKEISSEEKTPKE